MLTNLAGTRDADVTTPPGEARPGRTEKPPSPKMIFRAAVIFFIPRYVDPEILIGVK